MRVVAWSRSLTEEAAEDLEVVRCESPGDVASRCDVLSIHLAACSETEKIINAEVLSRLRPGSYVVNTARASVLDYAALLRLMRERDLRVGLDVFPDEPESGEAAFRTSIVEAGGVVYGTHHIGASTDQAQEAIASEAVRVVQAYIRSGRVDNCVNLAARSKATGVLVVRHRNRPGVLAHTLNEISRAGVNVEEMENVICEGVESACAQIKVDGPLSNEALQKIESGNEHVFGVTFASVGAE
jgi:D-3-phosphoglycerate dehydrogenase